MGLERLSEEVKDVIVLDTENKPKFACMQISGLPKQNIFDKKKYALIPFVRVFLVPTETLKAAMEDWEYHEGVRFAIDLIYTNETNMENYILVFCEAEEKYQHIDLSEEVQFQIRNYLDGACAASYGFDVLGLLEQAKISMEGVYGKPDEPKVQCKRCEFDFTPRPTMETEGEYEAVVFECPTCHKKYIASVSDAALRLEIKKWKMLMEKYGKTDNGDKKNAFQLKMLDNMKKENQKRSRELCEVYMKLKEEKQNAEEETGDSTGSAGDGSDGGRTDA